MNDELGCIGDAGKVCMVFSGEEFGSQLSPEVDRKCVVAVFYQVHQLLCTLMTPD